MLGADLMVLLSMYPAPPATMHPTASPMIIEMFLRNGEPKSSVNNIVMKERKPSPMNSGEAHLFETKIILYEIPYHSDAEQQEGSRKRSRGEDSRAELKNPASGSAHAIVGSSSPVRNSRTADERRANHQNDRPYIVLRIEYMRTNQVHEPSPVTMGGNMRCKMRGGIKDIKISRKDAMIEVPVYICQIRTYDELGLR